MENKIKTILMYIFLYISIFFVGNKAITGLINDIDYLSTSKNCIANVLSISKIKNSRYLFIELEYYNEYKHNKSIEKIKIWEGKTEIINEFKKRKINIYYTKLNNIYLDILKKPNYFGLFLRILVLCIIAIVFYYYTNKLIKSIIIKYKTKLTRE